MRSAVIFVVAVVAAAAVVFLVCVTQFTADPLGFIARHPGYAVAALVPVVPVAVLARLLLRERPGDASAAAEVAESPMSGVEESPVPVTDVAPAPVAAPQQFSSVEQLAVASVLERGRSVADVARTLKVRPATVELWVARAAGPRSGTRPEPPSGP